MSTGKNGGTTMKQTASGPCAPSIAFTSVLTHIQQTEIQRQRGRWTEKNERKRAMHREWTERKTEREVPESKYSKCRFFHKM